MSQNTNNNLLFYKNIFSWINFSFSIFCILSLLSYNEDSIIIYNNNSIPCGTIGFYLAKILIYLFGVISYPLFTFISYIGYKQCFNIDKYSISFTDIILFILLVANTCILINVLALSFPLLGFYLKDWCYSTELYSNSLYPYLETHYCIAGYPLYVIIDHTSPSIYTLFGHHGSILLLITSYIVISSLLFKTIVPTPKNIATTVTKQAVHSIASTANMLPARLKSPAKITPSLKNGDISEKIVDIENQKHTSFDSNIKYFDINKSISNICDSDDFIIEEKDEDPFHISNSSQAIINTLTTFGIDAEIQNIHSGTMFTLFELSLPEGIKVQKIKQLADTISLRLKIDSVRIVCPVPGTDFIGIEVPNKVVSKSLFKACLRQCIDNNNLAKKSLPALLGTNVYSENIIIDIAKMPHLLIAGTTGSGKSVCINALLSSLITLTSPSDTRLILIDPKMVELALYEDCPHLLSDIIIDSKEAALSLKWLVDEMEKRYETLMPLGIKNIDGYNQIEGVIKMPKIVCFVDEFNDLMMASQSSIEKEIESMIIRLAQKSRAVGIHLILATQRPSRDVITGLIKANFPARIAFRVSSRFDSQIILDEIGAEALSGNGDMLFLDPQIQGINRLHGCYLDDQEIIQCIRNSIKQFGHAKKLCNKFSEIYKEESEPANQSGKSISEQDALLGQAVDIAKSQGYISTTLLQRHLKIGYPRAASIVDYMAENNIVSEPNNQRLRKYIGE